jgi:adenosine kinase
MDKVGKLDILVVSPDDPEAMLRHTEVALQMGVAVAADPSQQMARLNGEEIKKLISGATYLFMNEYELALAIQKTG